jgi:hypothetical protein
MVVFACAGLAGPAQSAFAASATVYVAAGGSDAGNACMSSSSPCASVTHALSEVSSGGTVYVSGTIQEFNGTADPGDAGGVTVDQDVTIEQQPGAAAAVLEGASGGEAAALITIGGSYRVTLDGLALDDADNTESDGAGGAISNGGGGSGHLLVQDSTFSDDSATTGGAISNGGGGSGNLLVLDSMFTDDSATAGGAIDTGDSASTGVATIENSTFSGDSASDGGAIDNADNGGTGTLTVTDSTFSGNTGDHGGAIDNADNSSNGTLTITDSTFSGNGAYDGGAIDNSEQGSANSLITLEASIFSGDSATHDGDEIDDNEGGADANLYIAADVFNGTCDENGSDWFDQGYNAAVDQSCLGGASTDTVSSAVGQDLGPLASNGGDTQTIELLTDNPAWEAIPPATSVSVDGTSFQLCSTTDQRGFTSQPDTACNPGAVQVGQLVNPTITATLTSSGTESSSGWWDAPVTVSFTCATPVGVPLTAACPSSETLSSNGRGQTVTQTITAADGGTGSVTVIVNIDQQAPTVTIAGPTSGATYKSTAPTAIGSATESLSGVASLNLSTSTTKTASGYLETITATAVSNAGVSASARVSFNVDIETAQPPASRPPATRPPTIERLKLKLVGPIAGATYLGRAPKPRCVATLGHTVINSCRLAVRNTRVRYGIRETITATATASGLRGTVRKTFVVETLVPPRFQGFEPVRGSTYVLPLGRAYQLVVLSHARPTYVYGAPAGAHPAGGDVPLRRDGTVHGLPRWEMTVRLPDALKDFPYWNIGVAIGKHTYVLTVRT